MLSGSQSRAELPGASAPPSTAPCSSASPPGWDSLLRASVPCQSCYSQTSSSKPCREQGRICPLRRHLDLPHQGHSSLAQPGGQQAAGTRPQPCALPRDKQTGLAAGSHCATSQGKFNEFASLISSSLGTDLSLPCQGREATAQAWTRSWKGSWGDGAPWDRSTQHWRAMLHLGFSKVQPAHSTG